MFKIIFFCIRGGFVISKTFCISGLVFLLDHCSHWKSVNICYGIVPKRNSNMPQNQCYHWYFINGFQFYNVDDLLTKFTFLKDLILNKSVASVISCSFLIMFYAITQDLLRTSKVNFLFNIMPSRKGNLKSSSYSKEILVEILIIKETIR